MQAFMRLLNPACLRGRLLLAPLAVLTRLQLNVGGDVVPGRCWGLAALFQRLLGAVLVLAVAGMATAANAATIYTDQASFDAAVASLTLEWSEDFEGFSSGALPSGPVSVGSGRAEIFTGGPQEIYVQTNTGNQAYWNVEVPGDPPFLGPQTTISGTASASLSVRAFSFNYNMGGVGNNIYKASFVSSAGTQEVFLTETSVSYPNGEGGQDVPLFFGWVGAPGELLEQIILVPRATGILVDNIRAYEVAEGSIRIKKLVDGEPADQKFTFSLTDPQNDDVTLNPSMLGDEDTTTANNLPTGGPYTITETPVPRWTLTVSGDGCTQNGNTATVAVTKDQTAECIFTNTRQTGSLKIIKDTIGGNDTFKFSIDGSPTSAPVNGFDLKGGEDRVFDSLPTGVFTIKEIVPDGWKLKNAKCNKDFDSVDNGVRVEVGDGENVICTFNDFKKNDEAMEEETKRFIYRRVDNLLTHGPDRARMLGRLQEQAPPSSNDGPLNFSGKPSGGSLSNGSGGVVHNSDTMLADDGVPWMRDTFPSSSSMQEDAFGTATGPASTSSSLFSSIASQLTPLAARQTSFKFGTSLSEIRTKAAEADARAQQKKLQEAGLSFAGQPYANPFLAPRPGLDIWAEGHISRYNDDIGGINREGDFRILYVGADYVLAPGILIGALVQVDDTKEDINGSDRTGEIEGTGWMVGPYIGVKLLDNLFFDARGAWGQSDNDIWLNDEDAGFRRGSFDTRHAHGCPFSWAVASLTGTRAQVRSRVLRHLHEQPWSDR